MAKYKIRTLQEKEAIMACYKQHGWKVTSKKYQLSRATLVHWQLRIKEAGNSDAHPLARRRHIRPETVAYVKQLHKQHPDFSIGQLREEACQKQKISRTTIWHIIKGR